MYEKLNQTRRQFVLTTTILAAASTLILGVALYEANIIKFNNDIDSSALQAAVEEHPEVQEYLETEHQNEAHFITIANIIKTDQQESLGRTMLLVTIPVVLTAAAIGYLVARILLRPVKESYEAQERFLADAAHELRNPLATMSAIVQNAARTKSVTKAEFEKYMVQIRRQLSRMVRINEDLLFLERDMDSERDDEVNVSELLEDVLEDMKPHATDRKLAFDLDIQPDVLSTIRAQDFVRVAKNVIENAIKYSRPSSKKVSVTLASEKDKAKLVVKDQGIGIPESDLSKIEDRFFRASNVGDLPGSGLGLSIIQKVVDTRGGSLSVESKVKKGTTVTVVI